MAVGNRNHYFVSLGSEQVIGRHVGGLEIGDVDSLLENGFGQVTSRADVALEMAGVNSVEDQPGSGSVLVRLTVACSQNKLVPDRCQVVDFRMY